MRSYSGFHLKLVNTSLPLSIKPLMAILLNKEKVIETSAYYKLKVMYLFHRSSLLHSEYLIHNTLKTEAHKNCLNLKTHVTNSVRVWFILLFIT